MRGHYCSAPDSPLSERNFATDPQLRRNCDRTPTRQHRNRSWRASQQDQQSQGRVIMPPFHQLHHQSLHGYFGRPALSHTSFNSNLTDRSVYAGGQSVQTSEPAYQPPPPPYPGVSDLVSSVRKWPILTQSMGRG